MINENELKKFTDDKLVSKTIELTEQIIESKNDLITLNEYIYYHPNYLKITEQINKIMVTIFDVQN